MAHLEYDRSRGALCRVALIGPRRSGKTSLLHFHERAQTAGEDEFRAGRDRCEDQRGRVRLMRVDFQNARYRGPADSRCSRGVNRRSPNA